MKTLLLLVGVPVLAASVHTGTGYRFTPSGASRGSIAWAGIPRLTGDLLRSKSDLLRLPPAVGSQVARTWDQLGTPSVLVSAMTGGVIVSPVYKDGWTPHDPHVAVIPLAGDRAAAFVPLRTLSQRIANGIPALDELFDNRTAAGGGPAEIPTAGLAGAFANGLLAYHRVDGRNDGSGLTGVQLPPVPGIADDVSLKAHIGRLSNFLAQQPGIAYQPTPADPDGRARVRRQIAQAAAADIRQSVMPAFMAAVESISDPHVKLFVKKALKDAQPEFWRAPSSSTGKYHPADEINYGGLLVHTVRNVVMGRMLAGFFGVAPHVYDLVAAAEILHDIDKGGIPWKHDTKTGDAPDSGYVTDHGPVAAEWLKNFKDECGPDCDQIIDGVRTHMAQWNKPGPTPPKDLFEQIVSYSDYLASQDTVYVDWHDSKTR